MKCTCTLWSGTACPSCLIAIEKSERAVALAAKAEKAGRKDRADRLMNYSLSVLPLLYGGRG